MERKNLGWVYLCAGAMALGGCYEGMEGRAAEPWGDRDADDDDDDGGSNLAQTVRGLASAAGMKRMSKPPKVRAELVTLGQNLAFDKILSGNGDVSCMTCHHPTLGTTDARSLSVGVDGSGLGPKRKHPDDEFIPRSAPALFNLHEIDLMFWDGRVNEKYGNVDTPAGGQVTSAMQNTFEFGVVSAQAMFPVTSGAEMRGAPGTNDIAGLPDGDFTGIWDAYMERLADIPEYVDMFEAAYPGTAFEDMTFAHAANAIAGFEIAKFSSRSSKWDKFLGGKDSALNQTELEGALAFFDSGCANCHSGQSMSDFAFHNTGLPQVGPGKGDGPSGHDDFGRFRETGNASDKYAFRTAPLRNIELTGPYGHAGQFPTLESFVSHYVNPEAALLDYDPNANLEKKLRNQVLDNADDIAENISSSMGVVDPADVPKIVAFLEAMTDSKSKKNKLQNVVPSSVPSGLPVKD